MRSQDKQLNAFYFNIIQIALEKLLAPKSSSHSEMNQQIKNADNSQ